MKDESSAPKVLYFYSDRSETSVIVSSIFEGIAEAFKNKPLIFGRLNIDKNEIPELHDIAIPSLIIIRHYGD